MKRIYIIIFLFMGTVGFTQTEIILGDSVEKGFNEASVESYLKQDYEKNYDYTERRNFDKNLKNKYSGKEFQYSELEEPERQEREIQFEQETNSSSGFFNLFGSSLPFIILIILAIIVIVAILQRSDFHYFRLKRHNGSDAELLSDKEDESIDEGDFERLLQRAIHQKEYRLATRYYYLWLLQKLSQKNYIEYHKDKTNSEYQFELKDQKIRSDFSYLSYIYSYIWYGEFPIDQNKFVSIEKKYQSFMKRLK